MSANVSQSYNVLGQAPLDAKLVFKNKQAFIDHTVNNEFFAFNFYKGMLVYFQEEETFFIWELAYSPIYEQNNKVLENNFVYPLGTVYNGLDYSEKAFNLIEIPINKSNIGQWNDETLDEKTLTIVVDESTISNVFVPEQITEIWPQAEKISFIDGNINGIKFQGKQIEYNEEFSLLDWDQLTYEVWNPDAAYIQNAKMRVVMIGENIDYSQYNNRILGNSFNEIGIISENVSAKNKNSIYFSSEGNSFDILIVDKFFVVRKLSDYYSKKDASNVSQNATDWRTALELYSITEIQGLYMALQHFVNNGKIRADKIEALSYNTEIDGTPEIASDILFKVDKNTGENINYRETTKWKDGTSMTDAKVDGTLYKKINNKYYRLEIADKINVKWFGAKGDGITDDTAAIQNAINNSLGRILFFPKGNYKHTGLLISDAINIEGESMNETLLTNTSASNFGIRVYNARGYMLPFTISNLQVRGTSTGAAILVDTEVKLHITHVYVIENEGIGVQIGTNGNHVSLLTISECTFQKNKGDAIYGVANSTSQINAVNILDCSISGNYANGIKLTGTSINIENNTIQGNTKCGILISNFDQNFSNQSTKAKISGNYLELNKDGNVIIEVGLANGFARTCSGLEFSNNYSLMNSSAINSGVNTHFKINKTANITSVDQYIRGFIFEGNRFSSVGTFIYADFGDALSVDSVLRFSEKEDTSEYVAEDLNTKYINFGLAKVFMAERLVVNGFFNQKGGDINYTNLLSYMSDSVDISTAKIAYYNLPIPSNKIIINASVYVNTDSTNYSVTFNVISRDPRLNGNAYTNLFNDASNVNKSGSQLIIGANLATYGSANNRRIKRLKEDLILKITVQGTNGTYFKIGNPILIIN